MSLDSFVTNILKRAESSELVKRTEVQVDPPIARLKLIVNERTFIQVFRNFHTGTVAYTLMRDSQRVYGVDKDSIRDWHEHPVKDPESHIKCKKKSFGDFLKEVEKIIK